MTRNEALLLPAGPALDNLVAVRVFGWPEPGFIINECHDPARPIFAWRGCLQEHKEDSDCDHGPWHCGTEDYYPAPKYSFDVAAAWLVLERLKHTSPGVGYSASVGEWWASLTPGPDGHQDCEWGESAPLAICRAALAAWIPPE